MQTEAQQTGDTSRTADPNNDDTVSVVSTAPGQLRVIKRNGAVVAYDESKISVAITKAYLAVEGGNAAASSRIHESVAQLARQGGRAVGLSGADAGLLIGETFDERLGLVGRVTEVGTSILHVILDHGLIPVVAPVAFENTGGHVSDSGLLNLNADTAAAHIAIGLNASRLVFLTDVPGILDAKGNLLEEVDIKRGEELLSSGAVTRGMIPKVEACMSALTNGIESHIVDGRVQGTLVTLVNESWDRPHGTVFM